MKRNDVCKRLEQLLGKASFSSAVDKHAALECVRELAEPAALTDYSYQQLFDAIAAATRVTSGTGHIAISVIDFRAALLAAQPAADVREISVYGQRHYVGSYVRYISAPEGMEVVNDTVGNSNIVIRPAAPARADRVADELTAQASWVPSGPAGVMHRAAAHIRQGVALSDDEWSELFEAALWHSFPMFQLKAAVILSRASSSRASGYKEGMERAADICAAIVEVHGEIAARCENAIRAEINGEQ